EEQGGGGIVAGRDRGGGGFVQRRRDAAAGEPAVDRFDPERQARPSGPGGAGAFDGANLVAQGGEARISRQGSVHATRTHMFTLCSASIHRESRPAEGKHAL